MKEKMFNRRRFCAVSFILAAVLSLGGACANNENAGALHPVESLKITGAPETAVDLSEKSVQLGVEYSPEQNVEPFAVRWYCDGQSVATVSENGTVTLLSAGKIVISASVIGKREISDKVTIEVKNDETPVTSLKLTGRPENDTVSFPSEPFTLSYASKPENADEFSAEWYSTSDNVATIDEKGKVRVHGKGATEIGVRVKGKKSVSDSFVLYVGGAPRVCEIAISGKPQNNTMRAGTSTFLSCEYLPQDCGWFKEEWQSSDVSVAQIGENGELIAVNEGRATITLTAKGTSVSDSFELVVSKGLDPLCEDFEYAALENDAGSGNYRKIAKNYEGVNVSLTDNAEEIPQDGSGKALKVSAGRAAFAGVILIPRATVTAGKTYRFSAKIKMIDRPASGDAFVFCNVKTDGKTHVFKTNSLAAGESVLLTGEFTAENGGEITLEIFAHNGKGEEMQISFCIDDVALKTDLNAAAEAQTKTGEKQR